jgi:formylglycine-generating enzyme required for sulfatase activity
MMSVKGKFLAVSLLAGLVFAGSSCQRERSGATGWEYNNPKNGGFYKAPFLEQETGPGLVLIQGGRFTMGRVEQDVTYQWENIPRTVTVSSFYMDETEVTNFYYLEYLYWLARIWGRLP